MFSKSFSIVVRNRINEPLPVAHSKILRLALHKEAQYVF
jgi:hypothetical protein